ncbi:MAG: 50S ribosomal protein L9 [Acidobacteria bacterium]|nr:50S ribosomal protein L9 [Acidobacteriota bacterium]
MEVILRDHIDNLGRRGDIVNVANGYARNYLLPQKLALLVTPSNRRQVERERVVADAHEADERARAESFAERLRGTECVLPRRVGETGTLYGSVTSADVADHLATLDFEVDKRHIQLGEPLKELGEFPVTVKLHRDVSTEVTVKVVREETGDESAEAAEAGAEASPESVP